LKDDTHSKTINKAIKTLDSRAHID